jgi:hypothetical protein
VLDLQVKVLPGAYKDLSCASAREKTNATALPKSHMHPFSVSITTEQNLEDVILKMLEDFKIHNALPMNSKDTENDAQFNYILILQKISENFQKSQTHQSVHNYTKSGESLLEVEVACCATQPIIMDRNPTPH